MFSSMLECGCSFSGSMFGNGELLSVSPCFKHAMLVQAELTTLKDRLITLVNLEKSKKKTKTKKAKLKK